MAKKKTEPNQPDEQEMQRRRTLIVAAVAKQEFERRFAPPVAVAAGPNIFATGQATGTSTRVLPTEEPPPAPKAPQPNLFAARSK